MNMPRNQRSPVKRVLTLILPVIVIAASVVVAFMVLESKPTATRAPAKARQARLVTVTPAEAAPATLTLRANGTVEAADSTELRARVSGQIVALQDKLAPGTRFSRGNVLARIDDSDYRLALTSAKTDLAGARASLRVEQGQQAVARRELALVGSNVSANERDLALRGPQLEQAKADVQAAQTAVEQAQLDLDRTQVRAPFDGIVTERSASLGDVVATSDTLATLAATDAYWVDVSLPVDQLRWLKAAHADRAGSPATIHYADAWGTGPSMPAEVLRIQPGLETDGRMARVILRVADPLGADAPEGAQLLLGAYVQAGLQASIPTDSVLIDAAFVHENNQIWVMTGGNTLDIRSVNIAYRDNTQAVIVAGLQPGNNVITSELTAPIQGMPIRVESNTADAAEPAATAAKSAANAASQTLERSLQLRLAELPDTEPGRRQANAGANIEPRS